MRKNNKRRAGTTVEFAVVMPLLLMVLFGIIEFGWFFCVKQTAQHASREGARVASLSSSTEDLVQQRVDLFMQNIPHQTGINTNQTDCTVRVSVIVDYGAVGLMGDLFGLNTIMIDQESLTMLEGCHATD